MADKTIEHIIDDLKQFFARKIATVNKSINKKFDELTLKLQEIDNIVSETTKLAEYSKRQMNYLVQERLKNSLSTKIEKQDRRIVELEEQIEDQINRNNCSAYL